MNRHHLACMLAVAERDLLRHVRDRGALLADAGQVAVLLLVFGVAFQGMVGDVAGVPLRVYVFPGVACMNLAMTALTNGISLAWDRTHGFARELLVAPVPRWVLPVAKTLSAGGLAFVHLLLLLPLAAALGVRLTPWRVAATLGTGLLLCLALGALGVLMSVVARRPETVAALMGIAMTPLFMLSGAVFRVDAVPPWLRAVISVNPLTHAVDLLRAGMLGPGLPAAAARPVAAAILAVMAAGALLTAARAAARFVR